MTQTNPPADITPLGGATDFDVIVDVGGLGSVGGVDVAVSPQPITVDTDPVGVQGPKGDTGATGPQGPVGPQGPAGSSPDIQTFLVGGATVWSKPANAKLVQFIMCGGGGGGGSGRKGAASSARYGGGGGGGGGLTNWVIPAASVPASGTVFVGAGGNGGAAQATASTNGNSGSSGGSTRVQFGSTFSIYASGGAGGVAGTAAAGAGGLGGAYATTPGGTGGASIITAAANPQLTAAVPGGSGGGGISATNVAYNGGSTGNSFAGTLFLQTSSVAGGVVDGALPQDGVANQILGPAVMGCGGGAASITTNAQKGGAGANYGGGGGGGGASADAVGDSGAGGKGGDGFVQIITYF